MFFSPFHLYAVSGRYEDVEDIKIFFLSFLMRKCPTWTAPVWLLMCKELIQWLVFQSGAVTMFSIRPLFMVLVSSVAAPTKPRLSMTYTTNQGGRESVGVGSTSPSLRWPQLLCTLFKPTASHWSATDWFFSVEIYWTIFYWMNVVGAGSSFAYRYSKMDILQVDFLAQHVASVSVPVDNIIWCYPCTMRYKRHASVSLKISILHPSMSPLSYCFYLVVHRGLLGIWISIYWKISHTPFVCVCPLETVSWPHH